MTEGKKRDWISAFAGMTENCVKVEIATSLRCSQ